MDFDIQCKEQDHTQNRIQYYCNDTWCQQPRLLCYKCLIEATKHEGHTQNIVELKNIPDISKDFSKKCQEEVIDQLSGLTQSISTSLEELTKKIKQQFQQKPKFTYTYEQLSCYLFQLLDYDNKKEMLKNKIIKFLEKINSNIYEVIKQFEVYQFGQKSYQTFLSSTVTALHQQTTLNRVQKIEENQKFGAELKFQEITFNILENYFFAQAEEIIDSTLELDPQNSTTLILKGIHLLKLKQPILSQAQYNEAYNIFDKVLRTDPNNIKALNEQQFVFKQEEEIKQLKLIRIMNKPLYQIDTTNKPNQEKLIVQQRSVIKNELGQDNKLREAKNLYEEILKNDQQNIEALWGLADLLFLIQYHVGEAIMQYEKVLKINSKHAESISGKGDCYRLLERYEEGMQCLKKAQQINPKHVLTLTRIGDCLKKLEDNQFVQDNKGLIKKPSIIIVKPQVLILKMSCHSLN